MESEIIQHIMVKGGEKVLPNVNEDASTSHDAGGNVQIEANPKNFLSVEERIKALQLEISKLRSTSSLTTTTTREKEEKTPEKLFERYSPANDEVMQDVQPDNIDNTLSEPEKPIIKSNDANSEEKLEIPENNHNEEKQPDEIVTTAIIDPITTNIAELSADKDTDLPLKSGNPQASSQETDDPEYQDKENPRNTEIKSEMAENEKPQKMPDTKEEESQQNHEETNANHAEDDNPCSEQANEPVPTKDEIPTENIKETWDETESSKDIDDARSNMKCSISADESEFVPVSQMHLVLHSIKEGTSLMNEILNQLKRANDILISSFSN